MSSAADLNPMYVGHTGKLGGAELCLLDLMRHRPGAGLCCFEDGPLIEQTVAAGVPAEVLGEAALRSVRKAGGPGAAVRAAGAVRRLAARLAEAATNSGADALYANSLKAMIVSAWAGRRCGLPVIWHVHDLLTAEHFSRTNLRACRWAARWGVRGAIANSRASAEAFAAAIGRRVPVRVVYNGFDPEAFILSAESQPRDADATPTLGLFARLAPWKGQHVAIDALAKLRSPADAPPPRLRIVGDALFGEDDYARQLRDQAQRLGLADRVEFLGFRGDVAELLHGCDVVVHASTSAEPFGRAIVEAMLAGRAVVATDAGGVPEIIDPPRTGRLVPPGDADALADALTDLLADPAQRQAVADAGQAAARERFALSRVLPAWDDALHELLRPRPRRAAAPTGMPGSAATPPAHP